MRLILFIAMAASTIISINASTAKDIISELDIAVRKLNALYYNNTTSCLQASNNGPSAVNCSGIFIHGIEYTQQHVWIPDQNDPRKAVSFSYLRSDIPTTNLYDGSGFIYDQSSPTHENKKLRLYCFYPFDAFSAMDGFHPAASHGCGLPTTIYNDKTALDYASCPQALITTADQWIAEYLTDGKPSEFVPEGCSFSPNDATKFLQVIEVQTKTDSDTWNELITETWTEQQAESLPIIAFFYIKGDEKSEEIAKNYQTDYCNMYKKFLPVVSLDLSKRTSGAFGGNFKDQYPCF
ncbi:hypothetical protein [Ochrobactrum sp. Marseille-Q0166]|uniref:hypothetical protein n=1 Tax=Ochrobactrum sp. Marseille-Q0166 TaxID=2761105 RepID=UPI001655E1A6|nr:hypothetical protein [Ochrobactrum sp. Marseille-Q0166]MBC8716773.1 hypothetical protein [Ochrobactrum sp. Marseille-Q0166]